MEKKTYYVAFNTKEMPGLIVATSVSIGKEVIRNKNATFPINLCEHPLYPALVQYVMANPVMKKD